jgi:alpha-tubulin suppressor-like RCC1 family protein
MQHLSTTQTLIQEKFDRRVFISGLLGFEETKPLQQQIVELIELRNIDIKQISAGGYHCSFLTVDNEIFSIGWNELGQCGVGDFEICEKPKKVEFPKEIKIKKIKSSGRHSLILTEDGRVFSYGCCIDGRLGIGNIPFNINTPALINGLLDYRVEYISTGFWHNIVGTSCGKIFSWGNNDEGKLGLNNTQSSLVPIEISSLRGTFIKQATGGAWHSMLLTTKGRVFTWGSNYWGQLGLDDQFSRKDRHVPTEIEFFRNFKVKEISAGSNFSFCLLENGDVYSWGCGSNSKIGHESEEAKYLPTKIESFPKNEKIISLRSGSNHSLFLCQSGKVYSCGWNKYFQLGHESDSIPMEIELLKGIDIKNIDTGAFYSVFCTKNDIQFNSGFSNVLKDSFEDVLILFDPNI